MPPTRTRSKSLKSPYFEKPSDSDGVAPSSGEEFIPEPKLSIKSRRKPTSKPKKRARRSKQSLPDSPDATESEIKSTSVVENDFKTPAKKRASSGKKKAKVKADDIPKFESESDEMSDDDAWEDVSNHEADLEPVEPPSTQKELEFLSQLLSKPEDELSGDDGDKEIVVTVSTQPRGKSSANRDPKALAALALARQLRERALCIHSLHVVAFLTFGRFANRACDHPTISALALSLVEEPEEWSVDALRSLILSFISRIRKCPHTEYISLVEGITRRLQEDYSTADDCVILMVAALRALGLDTRLVLALDPPPLKPTTNVKSGGVKKLKPLKRSSGGNKVISSSESEQESTSSSHHLLFAEVYLASDQLWYSLDLSQPVGRVTSEFSSLPHNYPYVVGFHSTARSYLGRSPVDLASKYDPHWTYFSRRSDRLPETTWKSLLATLRESCADDVADLLARDDPRCLAEVQRDLADVERTYDYLRSLPLPQKVQDFKNHPLYALRRHLLKFEVIYPEDAPVIGFVKVGGRTNGSPEPIYPRECVHICHTRESWLKEAKTVRVGEKPAKVVKAMMSMKRKLLQQESDGAVPMVEVYGPWQVEDYVPPVAENGVVPRNEHGNVELFKPCMLPKGTVHIRLPGIQYIAKRLEIDAAPAMVGWSFGRAGWAHPEYDGFVVCAEAVPALVDAWRSARMTAASAAAAERAERALANWRRLTKHLLVWQRVQAGFQLAKDALNSAAGHLPLSSLDVKKSLTGPTTSAAVRGRPSTSKEANSKNGSAWQSLLSAEPVFPRLLDASELADEPKSKRTRGRRATVAKKRASPVMKPRRTRRRRKQETSSEEEEEEEEISQEETEEEEEAVSTPSESD